MKEEKEYGMTQEYDRSLYDSESQKRKFREKVFGDRKTFDDPISGNSIHKSSKAAINKYHAKNENGEIKSSEYAKYSAEVDHIVSLEGRHGVFKLNPFLTDDDYKEIMNSFANLRSVSKKFNTSKGAGDDLGIAFNPQSDIGMRGRAQLVVERTYAEIVIDSKFVLKTGENVGKNFCEGATNDVKATAPLLIVNAVKNMVEVALQKKNVCEAVKESADMTKKVAIVGGTKKVVKIAAKSFLKDYPGLSKVLTSNEYAQIIALAMMIADEAIKYIEGDLQAEEFAMNVEKTGVTVLSAAGSMYAGAKIGATIGSVALPGIGTISGAAIGTVIGLLLSAVTTSRVVSIYSTLEHLDDYKISERKVRALEREAVSVLQKEREKLQSLVKDELAGMDKEIREGFDLLLLSSCESAYSFDGVTKGLDKILGVFGTKAAFHSVEEWENQLDKELVLA